MRQCLYIEHLAELTPWSAQAIRPLMARGMLREGVHYFKPHGPGSRPIFSWRAIVAYIESGEAEAATEGIPLTDGWVIDTHEAAKEARRLLG